MFIWKNWSALLFEGPDCSKEDSNKYYFYWNIYFVKLSYMPYNLMYNYKVRWPDCLFQIGYGNKNIISNNGTIEVFKYSVEKRGGEPTDVTDSMDEDSQFPNPEIQHPDELKSPEEYEKELSKEFDKIYKYAIENPGSNFLTRHLYDDDDDEV